MQDIDCEWCFFPFPLFYSVYTSSLFPPLLVLYSFIYPKSLTGGRMHEAHGAKNKPFHYGNHLYCPQVGVCRRWGGGEVFLIVPDINELRLIRGFTDLQVFREAAETWRAAGFDSVLYIYISNLLTSRLIILKSVYINSLRVTRVTVRLHFGWQCLQYPSHTG